MSLDGITSTFGALLLGGLFATGLSGMVNVQTIFYFKMFPEDPKTLKITVGLVAFLDTLHVTFIWAALWRYLIQDFGRANLIDNIYWSIALSVVVTGLLTFFVHCFFCLRIFLLSKRNWLLALPIITLAVVRLISASATTAAMLQHETFSMFKSEIGWLFTSGLALSTTIDIIIAICMSVLLRGNRKSAPTLVPVLDRLIMYTFETGLLTTTGTIVSMFFWILQSNKNLVFLGLHFVISKFYATSLLVTLNTRKDLAERRQRFWTASSTPSRPQFVEVTRIESKPQYSSMFSKPMEISVEQTVELSSDLLHVPPSPRVYSPRARTITRNSGIAREVSAERSRHDSYHHYAATSFP